MNPSTNPYPVSNSKADELLKQMEELEILEDDIVEKFIKGGGKGGQKINTTSNCVWLKHKPTGIEVKCQADRSRAMNRFLARRELVKKIDNLISGEKSKAKQEQEKIKRQKRKRSKRAKEKVLETKRKTSEKKADRRKIDTKNN